MPIIRAIILGQPYKKSRRCTHRPLWLRYSRPQGQARGGHVGVDVETFRVAHPGVVFPAGHLGFIIQKVNLSALVIKGLDLLEPLIPLQVFRVNRGWRR